VRSAELFGRNHTDLGAIAAVAEGPAAIAICRGGAAKTYAYTDPNEDAAFFAVGPGGLMAAVADGHHGARGAEEIVRWLCAQRAPAWTSLHGEANDPGAWAEHASALIRDAHAAILEQAHALGVAPAPTTLSCVLVRPRDGLLVHASIGDSHTFVVAGDRSEIAEDGSAVANDRSAAGDARSATRDLGWASAGRRRPFFLGEPFERGAPEDDQYIAGCEPLAGVTVIVLATDGLSERRIGVPDPAATVRECVRRARAASPALRPLEACRNVTEAALAAHRANRSGDNIAAAVLWLSEAAREAR